MNNNYRNEGIGMQKYEDDLSGVLFESVAIGNVEENGYHGNVHYLS